MPFGWLLVVLLVLLGQDRIVPVRPEQVALSRGQLVRFWVSFLLTLRYSLRGWLYRFSVDGVPFWSATLAYFSSAWCAPSVAGNW